MAADITSGEGAPRFGWQVESFRTLLRRNKFFGYVSSEFLRDGYE